MDGFALEAALLKGAAVLSAYPFTYRLTNRYMAKIRKCAYCDLDRRLTREHIWPKCIITRTPKLSTRYSSGVGRFFSAELVIADVCAECNNKKLSKVDHYFCSLFDRYFGEFHKDEQTFEFSYDYDMLLRGLLKITYNSSRAATSGASPFARYRKMILNGGEVREDVIVKLDIVLPLKEKDGSLVYPHSARCAEIRFDPELELKDFVVRCVAVNSFYFYLIMSKSETISESAKEELFRLVKIVPGVLVYPYSDRIIVDGFSGNNTQSIHEDFVMSTAAQFEDYKAREKK